MDPSIGALWIKESAKGKFLSGVVEVNGEKLNIVVFKNTFKKEGEKSPDYRIYASKPREEAKADDEDISF